MDIRVNNEATQIGIWYRMLFHSLDVEIVKIGKDEDIVGLLKDVKMAHLR